MFEMTEEEYEECEQAEARKKMKLKWEMTKGVVRCDRCGFITRYGYKDRNTICYNCHKGYFRFYVNENRPLNITTEGEEYEEYQAEEM